MYGKVTIKWNKLTQSLGCCCCYIYLLVIFYFITLLAYFASLHLSKCANVNLDLCHFVCITEFIIVAIYSSASWLTPGKTFGKGERHPETRRKSAVFVALKFCPCYAPEEISIGVLWKVFEKVIFSLWQPISKVDGRRFEKL